MSMKGEKVQRLPPEGGNFCDGCKQLVKFKLRATKPCKTMPGRMIAYLYCPVCGHKATQVRVARRSRKRITYVYET